MMTTNLELLDWAVLAVSIACVVAYLCRMDLLTYSGHRPTVVLMHACLACAAVMAGYHGWEGEARALDVFAVLGAVLWIVVSYPSWRGRVPAHFDSGPVPLEHDDAPAASVSPQGH